MVQFSGWKFLIRIRSPHFIDTLVCTTSCYFFPTSQCLTGWCFGTMDIMTFHLLGISSSPNWRTHIFQSGRLKPPISEWQDAVRLEKDDNIKSDLSRVQYWTSSFQKAHIGQKKQQRLRWYLVGGFKDVGYFP
jgi:hypothetical protein